MRRSSISHTIIAGLLVALCCAPASGQTRAWQVHTRGLLHQSVYNTGELGRAYNAGGTVDAGIPSLEWPPNSRMVIDRQNYPGQHNSFGSGIWLAGTTPAGRQYMFCGAVSDASGNPIPVAGLYANPISVTRTENFPVLANGELNPAFNPDEAEEIIVTKWGTPLGITVTRTSRAWSYPGYDSFIIYEYDLQNSTPDTMQDVDVVFAGTFGTSMFGYQRNHGQWSEAQFRGQPPNGLGDQFARFDLKRWMSYNHDREGAPEPDSGFFRQWSAPGNRGGLNSPQAAGMMVLYYDYAHICTRTQTQQVWITPSDSAGMWDANDKAKQPFLMRYENGNLPTDAKTVTWLNPALQRKTGLFQGTTDSTRFVTQFEPALWPYWKGRTKGSLTLSWWQPVVHTLGFYPYRLPPNESLKFVVAELAGYGPGVAGDRIYKDLGGNVRTGAEAGIYFNPVPSWYDTLMYDYAGTASTRQYIGSRYLQNHPLPWYVTRGVVSIRDVADRAIEMYGGQPLAKHDTLPYEPLNAPPAGRYNTVPIPVPSPVIRVQDTKAAVNKILWGPQVEAFASPRLRAPFKHYEVFRSQHPLGPWSLIDSVSRRDPRYFADSVYAVLDSMSTIGEFDYYAVVAVDSLGGRSGFTNITQHETQSPAAVSLGKVYVVPNPLVVTNGLTGSDPNGEVTDKVQFMGLTNDCTIRIFSYSGQLINTIQHHQNAFANPWYQITRNSQLLASGVYYFVVEDAGGAMAHGKFVTIH